MKRGRLWIALFGVLLGGVRAPAHVEQSRRSTESDPQIPKTQHGRLVVTGRVAEIHTPRLFSMRDAERGGRELLVLAPRPLSPDVVGAEVKVEGRFGRFDLAELKRTPGWSRSTSAPARACPDAPS